MLCFYQISFKLAKNSAMKMVFIGYNNEKGFTAKFDVEI